MRQRGSTAPTQEQPAPCDPTPRPDPRPDDVPRPSDQPPYLVKHSGGHPTYPTPPPPCGHHHDHGETPHDDGQSHLHQHPDDGAPAHDDTTTAAGGPTSVARQNQRNLSPEARGELYRRIADYVVSPVDPVRIHLENGHVHGTLMFLPWHRQFIRTFEDWQRTVVRDASDFLPLVFWDPSDPMPGEFWEPEMSSSIPSLVLPPALRVGGGLATLDFATFSRQLEAHHNDAHNAVGGEMRDPRVAPRHPVFWLLHAFYDNVYATWEALGNG